MTLVGLVVLILIAAVILWGVGQLPLDATLLKIVRMLVIVVVAIAAIYFIAGMFGFTAPGSLRIR